MPKYIPKPKVPTAKKPSKKKPPKKLPKVYIPSDFLRGGKTVGSNYTAWNTYGQGKPDFGKSAGPGEPYHEVTRRNLGRPGPSDAARGIKAAAGRVTPPQGGPSWIAKTNRAQTDPRISAIRKRLGWS